MASDQPLSCKVEGDELVIRIGINTLAYVCSQIEKYDYNNRVYTKPYIPLDNLRFAQDVSLMICREEEDGSSPISDFLDEMFIEVWCDGSTAFEHDPELN